MRATGFRPNQQQEEALIDYCLQRLDSLRVDNRERLEADRDAWAAYNNDQKARLNTSSVFSDEQHNMALPITAMIVESFIARAEDQVTGQDPFMKFIPQGPGAEDPKTAKDFDHYFRWKLDTRGRVKTVLEDAYTAIFVQRAAIFKSVWQDKSTQWIDADTNVLWDLTNPEGEQPLKYLDPKGEAQFIIENETPWAQVPDAAGNVRQVLEADDSIVMDPEAHAWRPLPEGMRRSALVYRGPKAQLLDFDTFLCPSTATSIEDADCVAEIYDKPINWVQSTFVERPWCRWADYSQTIQSNSAKPKSKTERNEQNKEQLHFDQNSQKVPLVEFWVRRDVLGWGEPQEFMVIIDPDNRKAIYYEFQATVCPDLKRPYTPIAIGRQKNRWWGYNLPEKIKQYQQYADKQFQRESSRNELNANPTGGVHTDAVEEEPETIDIGKGLWRLKKGKRLSDFIEWAEIPDLDTKTHALIEFVIYMVQLWLGVSNLSQGDYADVPENSTKYGIEQSLREASKIGRRWMRRIQRGFEELLTKLVKLQVANFDADEVYSFMEGNVASFATMSKERAANIEMDVVLELSQEIRQQDIQAAQTALAVQEKYFMTPPAFMNASRPLFEKILNALGFNNTDELLPIMPAPAIDPMTGLPVEQPAAPGQPPQPGQPEQPGEAKPDFKGSATSPTNWPGQQPVDDPSQMKARPA